ncbi:Ion_transport 2 and transmembrane domain-containing protein [Hexamita inflata]|uniref:Ion transport 2 and transmembrane domain-containing protein n=1 Tax=Hexamita inflata TaxID=28002 RepID=A0AA86PJ51_9EUKA|nr:Ion transport 2 and transmembrane domain-containing protein [Hexamita inflata]
MQTQDNQTLSLEQIKMDDGKQDSKTEVKKEHQSSILVEHNTLYSNFVMFITVLDYIWFTLFQNDITGDWFIIVWAGITVCQILDFVLLIYQNTTHHIDYIGLNFLMYLFVIASSVLSIILVIINLTGSTKISQSFALQFKCSAPVFNRGLIKQVRHEQKQVGLTFKISDRRSKYIYIKDFFLTTSIAFYPLFTFILFFAGWFQYFPQNTLDIFYYIIVTFATVGYGDITFKDSDIGRILMIIFIIASIVYVPAEITSMLKKLKISLTQINVKQQTANGVVIIGSYDNALASMMRSRLPISTRIVYIILGEQPHAKDLAFSDSKSMTYYYAGQFSIELAHTLFLHRAEHILIYSQQYTPSSDVEALGIGRMLAELTKNRVKITLILNLEHYAVLSQSVFRRMRNFYIFCYDAFFGIFIQQAVRTEGFSTFMYNILYANEQKCGLTYWLKQKQSKSELQRSVSKRKTELKLKNSEYLQNPTLELRDIYNNSLSWFISKAKVTEQSRPLGVDYYLSRQTQTKQAREFKIDDQVKFDAWPQTCIKSLAVVAFEGAPDQLLSNLVSELSDLQITIFSFEMFTCESSNVTCIVYNEDSIVLLDQLTNFDTVLIFHPAFHSQTTFVFSQYINALNLNRILIWTDEKNDETDNEPFRRGELVPYLKAYFTSVMTNDFKMANISLNFLEEIRNGNIILQTVQVVEEATVRQMIDTRRVLYVKHQNVIITAPESDLKLVKGDLVCVIKWKNEDEVLGDVEEIIRKITGIQSMGLAKFEKFQQIHNIEQIIDLDHEPDISLIQ